MTRILCGLLMIGLVTVEATPPAHAIGCISGGLAGAAAGHLAHHGILGAVGGCLAGHAYHKHQQNKALDQQQQQTGDYGHSNSSSYSSGTTSHY